MEMKSRMEGGCWRLDVAGMKRRGGVLANRVQADARWELWRAAEARGRMMQL